MRFIFKRYLNKILDYEIYFQFQNYLSKKIRQLYDENEIQKVKLRMKREGWKGTE